MTRATQDTEESGYRLDPVVRSLLVTLGIATVICVALLGDRGDYYSHLIVGFGLALGLTLALTRIHLDAAWAGLLAVAATTALALLGEVRWFGGLFFDWVDVSMGGLGACLAAAVLVRIDRRDLGSAGPWILAGSLLVAGPILRYADLGGWP